MTKTTKILTKTTKILTKTTKTLTKPIKQADIHLVCSDEGVTTTSLQIAKVFGKRHDNIIQKIESAECSEEFTHLNFKVSKYEDKSGKKNKVYTVTRDGFFFAALGFTGPKAAQLRETYINAFNRMEAQLNKTHYQQPKQLGRTQADSARKTITKFIKNYELKHAPKAQSINSRRALMQVHSFIRKYFNIDSYKNLDAGDLSTLNHSLNDNATAIFSNVKDLFVIDLNDQDAIEQTNNSIRITGKDGHVRHLSLGHVLEQLDKAQEEKKQLPLSDPAMPHHITVILEAVQGSLINCNNQLEMVKSSELNLDLDQRLRIIKSMIPNFKVCMTNIEIVAQSLFVDNYKEANNTSAKEVLDNIGYAVL